MPLPNNERSTSFRHIYSNSFTIQISSNEIMVTFGIMQDLSNPDSVLDEATAVFSLASAKTLAIAMTQTIAKFETENTVNIPVPDVNALLNANFAPVIATNP